MRRRLTVLAAVAALVAAGGVAYAQLSPSPVKTTDAHEQNPAASADWFAWTERPLAHPNRAVVRAEPTPIDSVDDFRVNPRGTRGYTGGIDADTLVYQRVQNGQSNIRLFDLVSHDDTAHAAINTRQWEWHPSISTGATNQWILFGRQNLRTGVEKVLVHNMKTHTTRPLGQVDRSRHAAYPGQVNGDWATWTICKASCNVWYANLSVDPLTPAKVDKPSDVAHQYASSVTPDGTLYYVESGNGCGVNVKIDKWDQTNPPSSLTSLPSGRDIFFTFTSAEADNHVYFDRTGCSRIRWNIYQVIDAG